MSHFKQRRILNSCKQKSNLQYLWWFKKYETFGTNGKTNIECKQLCVSFQNLLLLTQYILLAFILIMLKTTVSFEAASWHKNPLWETPCITHHLLLWANLEIFRYTLELLSYRIVTSRYVSRITLVKTFFIPLPTFNLFLYPGSSPISFSLSPRYRRKLSPAQNESFFTQYSISDLFKAGFFWSESQSSIYSVIQLLK